MQSGVRTSHTELQLKSLKKVLIGVQYECILRSIEDELLPPQPPPFLDKLLPLHTIGARPRANAKSPGASVSRAPRTRLKKVRLEFCFLQGIKELVEPADNLRLIRLALIERHMEAHAVVDIDQQPGHKFRRNVSRKNAV